MDPCLSGLNLKCILMDNVLKTVSQGTDSPLETLVLNPVTIKNSNLPFVIIKWGSGGGGGVWWLKVN